MDAVSMPKAGAWQGPQSWGILADPERLLPIFPGVEPRNLHQHSAITMRLNAVRISSPHHFRAQLDAERLQPGQQLGKSQLHCGTAALDAQIDMPAPLRMIDARQAEHLDPRVIALY